MVALKVILAYSRGVIKSVMDFIFIDQVPTIFITSYNTQGMISYS